MTERDRDYIHIKRRPVTMLTSTRFRTVAALCATFAMAAVVGCGSPAANNTTTGSSPSPNGNTTNSSAPAQSAATPQQWSTPPAMQIDVKKQYDAVFHTNYGNFTIQLFANESPQTVNNFVFLAKHNFYNNDKFFRIMKTFMIQTGDPTNTGTGGPGYQFADELPVKHPYAPGIVAMANAGPNTNGSQFFICTGQDSAGLNQQPNYTEFGRVTNGMDVVQAIASIPVTTNPQTNEPSVPTKDAVIQSIQIVTH